MVKQKKSLKTMDMVEEELLTGRKYRNNSKLLEKFYQLKFPNPKASQHKKTYKK